VPPAARDPVTSLQPWPLPAAQPKIPPAHNITITAPEFSLISRRVLSLLCVVVPAFAAVLPATPSQAQSALATQVARPVALPDISIGSPKAQVTITEYASMSCPHCAAWGENVFPMLR